MKSFILGSGGTCGQTAGSRYCGQALHFQAMQATSIPICDCSPPFAVGIITDDYDDANSDKLANRGKYIDLTLKTIYKSSYIQSV